jgi:phospholipase C
VLTISIPLHLRQNGGATGETTLSRAKFLRFDEVRLMNRRQFLGMMAAASSALVLDRALPLNASEWLFQQDPNTSGIDHIVLVMMENRSFDHLMGWLPNANGRQAGVSFVDPSGVSHPTHQQSPDYRLSTDRSFSRP